MIKFLSTKHPQYLEDPLTCCIFCHSLQLFTNVFVTLLLVLAMCITNVQKVKRTEFFSKQLYIKFVLRSQHVLSYFSSQRHDLYLLDCVDLSRVPTGP